MRLFGAEVCFAAALTCSNVNMSAVTTATSSNNSNDGSKVGLRNIVVRTAMLEEAKLLTAIINDAFDDLSFLKKDEFATRVTRDGKQVEGVITAPCSTFLVAEDTSRQDRSSRTGSEANRVVGCVEVNWSGMANCGVKRPGVDAFFGMLSVKREHTRRGIGKLLVASAEQRCREELGREYIMEITVVDRRPDLFKWYQAQGYVMGAMTPFPAPEVIREGYKVMLQLMTKRIP